MSISRRVSIAWAPDYIPSEPTSTLVLTGRLYFVDQRIFHSPPSPETAVDWAFAGRRYATQSSSPEEGWSKCVWEHDVDSRSEDPVSDEGLLRSPYEGDPALALEKGEMINPATGKVTPHREVWRDDEVSSGTKVEFWERQGGGAMVGVIGAWALGVGREAPGQKAWTWRRKKQADERWKVVFEEPEGAAKHGAELVTTQPDAPNGGEVWVEKESWTTT